MEVRIPAGVTDGSRVRVSGEGERGSGAGASGDLYLRVKLRPHALFERKGRDLYTRVRVPVTTAVLGGEVDVPTLAGKALRLKIPQATQNGQVFRLRTHGLPTLTPVTQMQVKAEIARPALYEAVPAGQPYRVFGAAWTGESEVASVEVSTDGGQTWQPAQLLDEAVAFAWRLWEFSWTPPAPGRHTLQARATDRAGHWQPTTHDPDRRNYMINKIASVAVVAH